METRRSLQLKRAQERAVLSTLESAAHGGRRNQVEETTTNDNLWFEFNRALILYQLTDYTISLGVPPDPPLVNAPSPNG